jgi:hypothetical protein
MLTDRALDTAILAKSSPLLQAYGNNKSPRIARMSAKTRIRISMSGTSRLNVGDLTTHLLSIAGDRRTSLILEIENFTGCAG